jgi:hypothetical protein
MSILEAQHISRVLFFALALTACSDDPRPAATPPVDTAGTAEVPEGVIVAMGDSLTAGYGVDKSQAYPALLQARLQADGYPWKVVNAGISGETSRGPPLQTGRRDPSQRRRLPAHRRADLSNLRSGDCRNGPGRYLSARPANGT